MQKKAGPFIFAAIIVPLLGGSANADHFQIWIKAFIPNTGLDIVQPVPNTSGQWMIPGPIPATLGGACYNTNNRGFDSSQDADAKVTAAIEFDLATPGVGNVQKHDPVIGETLKYDCNSGAILDRKTADSNQVTVGDPALAANGATVQFDGQATNPLAPGPSALAPAITFHGQFTIDVNARTITFDGSVRQFPCYEAYVQVNGTTTTVFTIAPTHDASPWSLYLSQSVHQSANY